MRSDGTGFVKLFCKVFNVMMCLFDEEQIMKSFIRSEKHDEARETPDRLIKKGKCHLKILRIVFRHCRLMN